MRNSGSESSASNHTPPPDEESPRHRSGGSNASPRGRGANSPRHPLEQHLFNLPRPTVPPVFGTPGRSAFTPWRPPPPPPAPLWPSFALGPGSGSRGFGSLNFFGSISVAGPSRIGGSPISPIMGRKRGRQGGVGTSGGGGSGSGRGNGPGEEAGRIYHNCSVCNKRFGSSKALFGHMRSHPDRGWKGVHPPPSFKADEEFADIRMVQAALMNGEEAKEEEDESKYRVPDLNQPPPPDAE